MPPAHGDPPRDDGGVHFEITRPPSTNALYSNPTGAQIRYREGKRITPGRVKTKAYKKWVELAGWEMKTQRRPLPAFAGRVTVAISGVERIDLDNIKAIPDLLKRMGVIVDDGMIDLLTISRHSVFAGEGRVGVSVWPT